MFCKPKVWGSIPSPGTSKNRYLGTIFPLLAFVRDHAHPMALLDAVVAAAHALTITPNTHRANGARRVVATFIISRRVFDQLVNGRSGYQAQTRQSRNGSAPERRERRTSTTGS